MIRKKTSLPIEKERLFGEGVDLFKNFHAAQSIHGVLKSIGLGTSSDSDWFRAVANYLTSEEITMIYDKIIPPEKRRVLSDSMHRRLPELGVDDPDDILYFLSKNLVYRKRLWHLAALCYGRRVEEYEDALGTADRVPSATEKRFGEMQELFSLSEAETRILAVIYLSGSSFIDLGDYDVGKFRSSEKITALAKALGTTETEVSALVADEGNIRKYGLLDEDLALDRTFMSYLSGISSKPLVERFWTEYKGEVLPWNFHGKLAEKHGTVLQKMIKAKSKDEGLSILLYGVAGAGKTSFAHSLAHSLGKKLYFIAQNDDDNRRMSYSANFRFGAIAAAQKMLDPSECILVIDECDKMVENTTLGGSLFQLFGIRASGSRDGKTKGQLNSVIDTNRFTTLWICNSGQEAIDPSSRRRFDYNVLFDCLSADARQHIWSNALKFHNCEGKLSESLIRKLSSQWPVNPGGIAMAVKNAAAVIRDDAGADFADEVMVFLKAHCTLMGIAENPEDKLEPAQDYSLDGINIKSGIKLPRLIEVCRRYLEKKDDAEANRDQPRMNLLLFGVPGAGKTEFVKYLAKELDMKLKIKNAGDLLNCYVGVTEQRISQAFAEAEANNEILFIDEGDSLLSAREGAVRSWEVSQVNTLLSEMERFRGIFIVGTNLIQKLDQAALRRFSFRLHFDYLTNEGKEIFFSTYFTQPMGLPALNENEKRKLHSIESMTPSDFRNTRQQFFYLEDSDLSNTEIIEALAAEVVSKNSGQNYTGLGNIVHKMGF